MPFLTPQDAAQLRDIFAQNLPGKVRVRLFTRQPSRLFVPGAPQHQCATCEEARELVHEVAALTDQLDVAVHDVKQEPEVAQAYGVDGLLPAIVLEPTDGAAGDMGRVRFLGLPAGYEFSAFVGGLVDVSNRRVDLSPGAQQELRDLPEDIHIQVFVTPT